MKLGTTERDILRLLQRDGKMSNAELAERVGLSGSPCFRRVKALESAGVIRRYAARLDAGKLGLGVTAFVEVTMERQPDSATDTFLTRVAAEPHIVECHAMTGAHDYLMKVVARDLEHFSDLCLHHILKFPGVRHIESSISLRPVKQAGDLPV